MTLWPLMVVVFLIAVGVVILNLNFHQNLYKQKLIQEELKNKHQQEMLHSSIQVQEEVRKRIARDLHDELGATLSICNIFLAQLEKRSANEQDVELIRRVKGLTETSITTMRRISHELMPPQLEALGLFATLDETFRQLNQAETLKINLNVPTEKTKLPWPVSLGLYRVFMELLHNTIKHAKATDVHVHFYFTEGRLHGTYRDNGVGLSPESKSSGLGRKNLEARVSSLGGNYHLDLDKPGFSIEIDVPVDL